MALFRTLPTPTNDLLPRLMVEVCLVLAPDVCLFVCYKTRADTAMSLRQARQGTVEGRQGRAQGKARQGRHRGGCKLLP